MPGKPHNQIAGKKGEKLAATFLERSGYELIAANYRSGRGEIDLIVKRANMLVFVEVKARLGNRYGYPEEAVTPKKSAKLIETAEAYLQATGWTGMIRFDIVAVDLTENGEIQHFEDAFY